MLHAKVGFEAYQMCAALFCYTPEHYNAHRDSIVSSKGPWQMLRDNQKVHSRFIKACLEHDTTGDLHCIDQPTLLAFGGAEDPMTGDRIGQVMKTGIPRAEYAIIEGAPHAHQAFAEAEKTLSDMIGRFLRKQTPLT